MNVLDIIVLVVIAISTAIGVWRGFLKESLSLVTWGLAVWISIRFSAPFSTLLPENLTSFEFGIGAVQTTVDNFNVGLAMVLLFVMTLLIGALVQYLVGRLVEMTNLKGTDRALGAVFGLLRGYLVVLALAVLATLTTMNRLEIWQQSVLMSTVEEHAQLAVAMLPEEYARYFTPK